MDQIIFFLVQTLNFLVLIGWGVLVIISFIQMRKMEISFQLKLLWSVIIVVVPLIGAITFLYQNFENEKSLNR